MNFEKYLERGFDNRGYVRSLSHCEERIESVFTE